MTIRRVPVIIATLLLAHHLIALRRDPAELGLDS